MRHPPVRQSRRRRTFTVIPLVMVVLAAAAFLIATRISAVPQDFTPVSLKSQVDKYQANPRALRDDIGAPDKVSFGESGTARDGFTRPDAGVYAYKTTNGKEWLEQGGETYSRTFPSTTYATVLHGDGCVWEIWFQSAKQYSDSHRQCSKPGLYLCVAHMQDVELGGFVKQMDHICKPNMLMVGGKTAQKGGKERTVCYAGGLDEAKITIENLGKTTVRVGGESRSAYRVNLYSDITGGIEGKALAKAWFDTETGMYLKLVRKTDVKVKVAGESADYHVRATYKLKSLTPKT